MPSGFQQDINQLQPGFYRVVLTLGAGSGTYNGSAPADGAVNPYNWDSFATVPSSNANGERLARGNVRWQAIIEEVTKHADAQILDVEVTSAGNTNANNVPSAVAFTVKYDRVDFVLAALNGTTFSPTTGDEVTVDTVAKAIRYLVAQGIARNAYTRKWPTYLDQEGKIATITVNKPDDIADIYDDVAVNLIDGTEIISTI
jgi:hypothetical protein